MALRQLLPPAPALPAFSDEQDTELFPPSLLFGHGVSLQR